LVLDRVEGLLTGLPPRSSRNISSSLCRTKGDFAFQSPQTVSEVQQPHFKI